jgi:hypothetical protein
MKRWQLAFLIFELALFAAILVLPQVALPDFTFRGGTAPAAAHSRLCHLAPGTALAAILPAWFSNPITGKTGEATGSFVPPTLRSHLSQLCVLIC